MTEREQLNIEIAKVRAEIKRLREHSKELVKQRNALPQKKWSGMQDTLCVASIELREVLHYDGTVRDLALRAGISERTIQHIKNGTTKYTSLTIADALLTALGRPDALSTVVSVVPNPYRKPEVCDADTGT